MKANISAWCNPDVHQDKANPNNRIMNLSIAAVPSVPQDRAHTARESQHKLWQHGTPTQDNSKTKVSWFQFLEKWYQSKMFTLSIEWRKICKGFNSPYAGQSRSYVTVWFPKLGQMGWCNPSLALSPASSLCTLSQDPHPISGLSIHLAEENRLFLSPNRTTMSVGTKRAVGANLQQ